MESNPKAFDKTDQRSSGGVDGDQLLRKYGVGSTRFAGTPDSLYERHLKFDNVVEPESSDSRDDAGRHAPTAAPRDGSKLALMIDLLRRADGATIVDLTQATGWLAHTTRAAITGLRKRGYVSGAILE